MKEKAPLSYTAKDYLECKEEPPACVLQGKTEGEIMDPEDIQVWALEQIQMLSVMLEEFPEDFEKQYSNYLLDLEYLKSLGKITQEEKEKLEKRENFGF